MAFTGFLHAEEINMAISQAAGQFSATIPAGTSVAILGVSSDTPDMSDFLLDELSMQLVRMKKLTVVNRANLDIIKREMNFQLSGEVSDETIQSIGAKVGAKIIIHGTLRRVGLNYILTLQALDVSTAAIRDMYRETIDEDNSVRVLLAQGERQGKKIVLSGNDDYTGSERLAIGFQNLLFGLGSYRTGHIGDGLVVTALEGLSVLFIAMASSYDGYEDEGSDMNMLYSYLGIWSLLGGATYGFLRPLAYHKTIAIAANGTPDGLRIGLVSAKKGIAPGVASKLSF